VISVDARKREKAGNYGQDGREWRPAGSPQVVRSHDFPEKDDRHAVPYGVYDQAANAGLVNVGWLWRLQAAPARRLDLAPPRFLGGSWRL